MNKELRRGVVAKAYEVRKNSNVSLEEPVSPFTIAEKLKVPVFLQQLKGVEGVYAQVPKPVIIVNSLRSLGRQNFTCAHELGHHLFGHGTKYDLEVEEDWVKHYEDENERVADTFASFLLMPQKLVFKGFKKRGWNAYSPTYLEVFYVAASLGVGYSTLINHMHYSLEFIDSDIKEDLLKKKPKDIKTELIGHSIGRSNIIQIDRHFNSALDLFVDDYLYSDDRLSFSDKYFTLNSSERSLIACYKGKSKVFADTWSVYCRVSKEGYVGLSQNRSLEDCE